ncbi:hypothetical protein Nepgr_012010 [Nepenthes gracilis]|uniref:Uncharacterized protein n=1 Tax=Nepenthes gracilis TaxID=150966 RepID=A0AAD3XMS7_NEPGR|nr:hypothetical protein Nepgr_012010 [Nepenthes gracilis]
MASQLAASSNQTSLQLYNVDVDCPCQSGTHRKLAHTFNSKLMASAAPLQSQFLMNSVKQSAAARRFSLSSFRPHDGRPVDQAGLPCSWRGRNKKRSSTVVAAVGELSADSTTYLVAGAAAVALLGTAFPIFFSRKDLCPECDGAGFVRRGAVTLRVNAARKDEAQIVCKRCNGLGKLNQIDK